MKNPEKTVTGLFIATDQRNWEDVKMAFDSKVVIDYSSMNGNPASELSPEQITDSWKSVLPGFESTHHQLGNFVTIFDGDTAKVFCYGTAYHFLPDPNGNVWTVVGSYNFELLMTEQDKWVITLMKFNFKFQDGNILLPEKAMNMLKKMN